MADAWAAAAATDAAAAAELMLLLMAAAAVPVGAATGVSVSVMGLPAAYKPRGENEELNEQA
jgi:hypothetical protein